MSADNGYPIIRWRWGGAYRLEWRYYGLGRSAKDATSGAPRNQALAGAHGHVHMPAG